MPTEPPLGARPYVSIMEDQNPKQLQSGREDVSMKHRLISFPPKYLNWVPGGPHKSRSRIHLILSVCQVSAFQDVAAVSQYQSGVEGRLTFASRSMFKLRRSILSILSPYSFVSGNMYPDLKVAVSNNTTARSETVLSSSFS